MDPLVRKRLLLEAAKARRQQQLRGLLNIEGAFPAGPEQDAIVDRARTEMSADRAGRGWDMAGQQQAVTTPFAQPLRQEAIQLAREGISDPTLGADVPFGGAGPLSQVPPAPSAPAPAPYAPTPTPYAPPARSTDKPATQTDYADFTRDYIEKVDKRSRMLRGMSTLFGVPDRSEDYATRALANFKGHMTQRGMGQLVGKEFTSNMALFDAAYNAGIPPSAMKDLFSLGLVKKAVKDEKKYKQYNFYDPAKPDQMQSGFIIEQPGQSPARFFYGADGQPTPVPSHWVGKSGGSTSVSVSTGMDPNKAVGAAMIPMAKKWMREAQEFWLNDEGELRDDLTFADTLGFMGPARTTRNKMERALSVALRLESGAAIGEDERAQFYGLFMPNWQDWVSGDREGAIVSKFKAFREYMDLLNELIGPGVGTGGSDEDKAAVAAAFKFVLADAEEKMKERKETVPEGKVLIAYEGAPR